MTDNRKIQTKWIAGFGVLILLILAMAAGNFLGIRQIRNHADLLIRQNLPQWSLAGSIQRDVGAAGYFMVRYEQRLDQKLWEDAEAASQRCMENIQMALSLTAENRSPSLSRHLQEMESTLSRYRTVMQRSRIAGEAIEEHHRAVRRSTDLFIENIEAYNTMQQHEMERQMEAAFTGNQPMLRFGLNLGSTEELKIRHERIQAGSRILAMGKGLYAELWEAEARGDDAALNAILPGIRNLHQRMAELLGVTRQPQNLKQLRSAMTALESNIIAVEGLIRTREIAENASKTRRKAYETLLASAGTLSAEAHDQAMEGGTVTRNIVENAAKIPLYLGGLAVFFLLLSLFFFGKRTRT